MDHPSSCWSVEHDSLYRSVSETTAGCQQRPTGQCYMESRLYCWCGPATAHASWLSWGFPQTETHTANRCEQHANLLTITPHNQVLPAKLCLINARSVCNKAELIVDYVTSHDIDIMCITETWLRSEDTASVSAVTPSGYHLEHVARTNGRGGGVGVLFDHPSLSTTHNFGLHHLSSASIFNSAVDLFHPRCVCSFSIDRHRQVATHNRSAFSSPNFEIWLNASAWKRESSYSETLTWRMAIPTMPTLERFTTYYQTPTSDRTSPMRLTSMAMYLISSSLPPRRHPLRRRPSTLSSPITSPFCVTLFQSSHARYANILHTVAMVA